MQKLIGNLNETLKQKVEEGKILVTGHTHLPEVDIQNNFINTGFIGLGRAWYLEIDENGFRLMERRY